MSPRVTPNHATEVAREPIRAAFVAGWPETQLADGLTGARASDERLDAATITRLVDPGPTSPDPAVAKRRRAVTEG